MNGRISKMTRKASRKLAKDLVQEKLEMPDGSIKYTGYKRMYKDFKKLYYRLTPKEFIKEMRSICQA